jgi:uncharacterized protein HemX
VADDPVSGTIRGPNGETVALRIGNKSLGGNVLGVVAVLLVLGAALGGAVIAKILFLGQTTGHETLADIKDLLQQNTQAVTNGQHELRIHMDEALAKQNELLHQQTVTIDKRTEGLEKYIEGRFDEMGERQERMNFNTLNPERALPLRGPPPPAQRQEGTR